MRSIAVYLFFAMFSLAFGFTNSQVTMPILENEAGKPLPSIKIYTGKKISFNFQNISVRGILQILADFTGKNIIVSDAVKGSITIRLNDIPWDEALDIILTTQGLGKRQRGKVLLIDTKKNMAKKNQAYLANQQAINTLSPLRSELIQINYSKAADIAALLKDKQSTLLTDRGRVSVDPRTNTLWIKDTEFQLKQVRRLVGKLDVAVRQVLIEARIVNVTKDFAQDLGIRFDLAKSKGARLSEQGGPQGKGAPLAGRLNIDLGILPTTASPASIGIALAKLGDGILLDLELLALESEGKAELISSPRLITTNQQSAVIESGEEIPYQEATSSGATAVAFKKAVLCLKVTPQITPDNKIIMDLKINQDIPSAQLFNNVPSILTKEIQTRVLVNNGQTIVLGGIYKQGKRNSVNRVPFLGELPWIGNLFRNRSTSIKNEELLIFITPKIIANGFSDSAIKRQGFADVLK